MYIILLALENGGLKSGMMNPYSFLNSMGGMGAFGGLPGQLSGAGGGMSGIAAGMNPGKYLESK